MSHFKNVNVVYQHVTDFERAQEFYGEILGWPTAYAGDDMGWHEYGVALDSWPTALDASDTATFGSCLSAGSDLFMTLDAFSASAWNPTGASSPAFAIDSRHI